MTSATLKMSFGQITTFVYDGEQINSLGEVSWHKVLYSCCRASVTVPLSSAHWRLQRTKCPSLKSLHLLMMVSIRLIEVIMVQLIPVYSSSRAGVTDPLASSSAY